MVNLFALLLVLSALSTSLCLSQSYSLYSWLCKYTVYLEGSLSTASAGRERQKTSEVVKGGAFTGVAGYYCIQCVKKFVYSLLWLHRELCEV